jgi:putative ABC transport system substrate-binding protein
MAGGLLGAPLAAGAQTGKKAQVSILSAGVPSLPLREQFRRGLRELGYVEGQNITLDESSAYEHLERLPHLAAALVRSKPDVIVVVGSSEALAARHETSTIPIVMVAVADPVVVGLVKSLARPGANVTGLTSSPTAEFHGKRLELLKEMVPGATRVAILVTSALPSTPTRVQATEAAARALGLTLKAFPVRDREGLSGAFSLILKERVTALLVPLDPLFYSERRQVAELAAKHNLPVMYDVRGHVDVGGLAAYGPSFPDLFWRAATYVDKILKGAKPGELPVEQPTKFEFVINLKTAKTLGLMIPPSLLGRADEVIQ